MMAFIEIARQASDMIRPKICPHLIGNVTMQGRKKVSNIGWAHTYESPDYDYEIDGHIN